MGVERWTSDEERWRAVLSRATEADGAFVYGVRSTGIFCRPSCPSRRPDRRHVRFFETAADAAHTGLRPCKRCRPLDGMANPWVERIRRACALLSRGGTSPSIARVAAAVGASASHFHRMFARHVGITPRAYAEASRFGRAKRALRHGATVTSAIHGAGYGSSSRFYERGAARLGMLPSAYRTGGTGMVITYGIARSPLGRLMVATTTRGVCAVALGADEASLVEGLTREYPAAIIERQPQTVAAATARLLDHLGGQPSRLDLPLDVRATAFQRQVWQALAQIPAGEVRTYGEVAKAIGRPRAVRAVARACATNPVAIAIPCHRVVPAAGGVGGYRWGVERKRRLLAKERGRK